MIRGAHWDWWQSTASTRLEPGGCAVVIATRWHEDDLSGRLIRAGAEGDGLPVRELRLPAVAEENDSLERSVGEPLWPGRWSAEMLEMRRKSVSLPWWLAQYQQRPGRGDGVTWGDEYFSSIIWEDEWPASFDHSAVAVDPAGGRKTGDYAAIVFAGLCDQVLWVDAVLEKQPAERVVADTIRMVRNWRPNLVGYESNQMQELLGREFDRQCADAGDPPLPLVPIRNSRDKVVRVQEIGPYLERKKIRFRDTPGARLVVQQLREFPLGRHDDGPDALQMAISLILHHRRSSLFDDEPELLIARA